MTTKSTQSLVSVTICKGTDEAKTTKFLVKAGVEKFTFEGGEFSFILDENSDAFKKVAKHFCEDLLFDLDFSTPKTF